MVLSTCQTNSRMNTNTYHMCVLTHSRICESVHESVTNKPHTGKDLHGRTTLIAIQFVQSVSFIVIYNLRDYRYNLSDKVPVIRYHVRRNYHNLVPRVGRRSVCLFQCSSSLWLLETQRYPIRPADSLPIRQHQGCSDKRASE